ncbi:MAG TPA: deoxyribonuclease IV [Candidatus Dormibacteraeota bacterium]|jgi:deoxyribonuclease-4|nr:deoxyribonuclease IV [Candidatus Dormibacteraeota bacterium]
MVKVGVHVSIAKSLDTAIDNALGEKCDDFQIFTRNPRGWQFKPLDPDEVSVFREKLEKSGLAPAVDHMPYLPNLSCPEDVIYNKSLSTLEAEVERCVQLGIPYLVTHLGSHLGVGRETGLKRISNALNRAMKHAKGDFQICLENMAGTKNSMGSKFEEVREILDGVRQKHHVAVCLDTCHAYAAGYDLHVEKAVEKTLELFDETVGFDNLSVVHLNDSEGGLGSGLDRHEHIGMGYIGISGFKAILHHKGVRDLPLILETPIDDRRGNAENLETVRKLWK